jgi:hypothetical protein
MVMAVMVAVILSDGGRDARPTLDKILYKIVGILGDFRGSLGFWGILRILFEQFPRGHEALVWTKGVLKVFY